MNICVERASIYSMRICKVKSNTNLVNVQGSLQCREFWRTSGLTGIVGLVVVMLNVGYRGI